MTPAEYRTLAARVETEEATERARLEGEVARLREALEQCAEYFDNRADAEYFTDSAIPVANDEMHMLTVVREALRMFPTIENNSIVPLCKRCFLRKLPSDCWDENCTGGPAP